VKAIGESCRFETLASLNIFSTKPAVYKWNRSLYCESLLSILWRCLDLQEMCINKIHLPRWEYI
jgi:hypothetical protein